VVDKDDVNGYIFIKMIGDWTNPAPGEDVKV